MELSNSEIHNALKTLVAKHTNLEKLLVWGATQTPPVMIGEVIAQDEFTNDIIVPYQSLFLVYDTN